MFTSGMEVGQVAGLAGRCDGLDRRCILCGVCGPFIASPHIHVIQKGIKGQAQQCYTNFYSLLQLVPLNLNPGDNFLGICVAQPHIPRNTTSIIHPD